MSFVSVYFGLVIEIYACSIKNSGVRGMVWPRGAAACMTPRRTPGLQREYRSGLESFHASTLQAESRRTTSSDGIISEKQFPLIVYMIADTPDPVDFIIG